MQIEYSSHVWPKLLEDQGLGLIEHDPQGITLPYKISDCAKAQEVDVPDIRKVWNRGITWNNFAIGFC